MFRAFHTRPGHYLLLAAVTAALTLPGLGSVSLWDIDEGLNAEASREMLESDDWVVPSFNFQPRTAKPALLYWLQALCYRQFGVNEFAARLPSAVAALLSVLLTYELGRRMFGKTVGLLGGVILISTVQVCVLAHAATPDAVLLAALCLTFALFWHGYTYDRRLWLMTTGLGCGLAVLAKGPVGLVLPAAVVGYFLLARRESYRLFDRRLAVGVVVFLLVAAPWYVLVGVETRGRFLKAFWSRENVGRFAAAMEGHSGPPYYYLVTLLVGLTPWCVLLGPALWDALRVARSSRRVPCEDDSSRGTRLEPRATTFLIAWVAVWVGFFSIAQTKLPNYVLPAYPPLALLTASFLDRWRRGEVRAPDWVWAGSLGCLALIGAVTGAGLLVAGGTVPVPALAGRTLPGLGNWAWVGLVPVAGAAAAAWYLRHDRRGRLVASLAAAAVLFIGAFAAFPPRAVDAQKAPRPLVAAAGACRPGAEVRVAALDYFQPSLVFYCRREVEQLATDRQALDFLRGPLPAYLFCPAAVWDRLSVQVRGPVTLLARHRDLYRNFDVVVVTNR
jgi:4-amino-4-deoxy-L-arabinose transferase-like glycosyltransferase